MGAKGIGQPSPSTFRPPPYDKSTLELPGRQPSSPWAQRQRQAHPRRQGGRNHGNNGGQRCAHATTPTAGCRGMQSDAGNGREESRCRVAHDAAPTHASANVIGHGPGTMYGIIANRSRKRSENQQLHRSTWLLQWSNTSNNSNRYRDPVSPNQPKSLARISRFLAAAAKKTM